MNAVRWNFSSPSIGNTDSVYTYSSQIADSIFGKIFYYVSGINWRPMASFNDFCHMDGKRFPLSNHTKYSSSQFPKERMKNTLYTHKKKIVRTIFIKSFFEIFSTCSLAHAESLSSSVVVVMMSPSQSEEDGERCKFYWFENWEQKNCQRKSAIHILPLDQIRIKLEGKIE